MLDKIVKFHRHNLIFGNYPGSLKSATVYTILANGSYVFGVDLSFGLCRFIQESLLNARGSWVGALSCTASALIYWAVLCTTRKLMLRRILLYKGWIYDGFKPSPKTRLFAASVRLLEGWFRPGKRSLYGLQRILPSLPVPALKQTVTRYLESMQPLLSPDKYANLEKLAQEFLEGSGQKFQKYLILKSWFTPNYVSDWWEKYVYLSGRSSLLINSNFYITDGLNQRAVHQAARAASTTYMVLQFRRQIEGNCLEPLVGQDIVPFCSWQYERMFNTCRIPGEEEDVIKHSEFSNHIVVFHKGRYFKMAICHHNNRKKLLSVSELQDQFLKILDDISVPCVGEERLAALTTMDRTNWAQTRSKYFSNGCNRESLNLIEKAAFMIILDDVECTVDANEPDTTKMEYHARRLFHGTGSNLWLDKSYNIVISTNGRAGLNVEHSWSDALISSHLWEKHLEDQLNISKVYDENGLLPTPTKNTEDKSTLLLPLQNIERMKWDLPKDCIEKIYTAEMNSHKQIENLDLKILVHKAFGKGLIKKLKFSPDAFIQMCLQLAYYRDQGRFDATYEATMTRLFKQGRTETIRSCSQESCRWVLAMEHDLPLTEKIQYFKEAINRHQDTYRKAMSGDGIDRHLFGLYVVSKYCKASSDFLNEALSAQWRLSTSQTPAHPQSSKLIKSPGGGFGPVAHDGYGVAYLICQEDLIFFHVNSYKDCPTTDSFKFKKQIERAMNDVRELFSQSTKSDVV